MDPIARIIICNGRIDLALAKNGFEMIRAASRAATALVAYYGKRLTYVDTKPISDLQHKMKDVVVDNKMAGTHATGFQSASEMCDDMLALLGELEKKMSL